MRRHAVDDNQAEISAFFVALGCKVHNCGQLGDGFPDLIVHIPGGAFGHNVLVEVKDGSKPPSDRRLTPAQVKFHAGWPGRVHIVESTFQVLDLVSFYRGRLIRATA